MGLTIHYKITPRQRIDARRAQSIAAAAHDAVAGLTKDSPYAHLSDLKPADPEDPWLECRFFRKVDTHTTRGFCVPPLRGFYFDLDRAQDCETARFGLCEYPATFRGEDGRRLRTGIGGWRFHAFCKTQYASLHGWEPFFASHKLVIEAALVWGKVGCDVTLIDEGNYWPGENVEELRVSLNTMNGIVAALGGAMKDAADDGGSSIQSPIFAHPRFEHLETEGMAAHAVAIRDTVSAMTGK